MKNIPSLFLLLENRVLYSDVHVAGASQTCNFQTLSRGNSTPKSTTISVNRSMTSVQYLYRWWELCVTKQQPLQRKKSLCLPGPNIKVWTCFLHFCLQLSPDSSTLADQGSDFIHTKTVCASLTIRDMQCADCSSINRRSFSGCTSFLLSFLARLTALMFHL